MSFQGKIQEGTTPARFLMPHELPDWLSAMMM
jgi:hypothetical protein